jgi:hypothetical protein
MPVPKAPAPFEVVLPKALFVIRLLAPAGPPSHYAVTRDGQSFYAVAPLQGGAVGTTNVVVHWTPVAAKR